MAAYYSVPIHSESALYNLKAKEQHQLSVNSQGSLGDSDPPARAAKYSLRSKSEKMSGFIELGASSPLVSKPSFM